MEENANANPGHPEDKLSPEEKVQFGEILGIEGRKVAMRAHLTFIKEKSKDETLSESLRNAIAEEATHFEQYMEAFEKHIEKRREEMKSQTQA